MELSNVHENGELKERFPVISQETDKTNTKPNNTCCDFRQPGFFTIEQHLLKYKSFFFFFGGAIGSVFPYFSVYFKQLGFSPNEIGIISGCRPIVGFCSGPIWGSLADRFRMRRLMLCLSTFGWLVLITSIGFVPAAKFTDDNCGLVAEFTGKAKHGNNSVNMSSISPAMRDDFYSEHKLRSDITPEESLMESRGWMVDHKGLQRVFGLVLFLVVFGEVVQSPAGALADSGCIEALGDNDMHKYGHQRAWGSLGLGIFSLLAGAVISTTREDIISCGITVTISNYRIAFYFFAGCMACCLITAFTFKFQKQLDDHANSKPRPNPLRVFRMFLTVHFGSWLFCMFFTGICNGVIWGFLFWHLENLGGTQLLLGVANGVSLTSEMLMFFFIFRLIDRFGCLILMIVGIAGYTVRFIVFALIDNPWLVLPFEVLQGATFAGVWSVYTKYLCSSVPSEYLGTLQGVKKCPYERLGATFAGVWSVYTKYLCSSVPSEYLGTLQGFLHGVYWGLGSGTGFMVGGILVQNYGARVTFWIFSVASFVNMLIFIIIQKLTAKPSIFGNYEDLDGDKKT